MADHTTVTVRIEAPALQDVHVEVAELEGVEIIGKLFEFRLEVVCATADGIDVDKLLTDPAELVFVQGDTEIRRLFGRVSSVRDRLHSESALLVYTMEFVPRVFATTLTRRSQVFVDESVPEVVQDKLTEAGFTVGRDVELRLISRYPKRDLVIQYEETDFDFISRLVEHLGISLFFEHQDGRDVLVFADDNSGFKPIDGGSTVPFYRRGDQIGVFALEGLTRTLPGKYVLKDYNYRTPQVELVAQAPVSEAGTGGVVEYGAHFKTKAEGDALAAIRSEELLATRRVFHGKSDVPVLRAGARFTIDGHPKITEELLLTEVRHRAKLPVFGIAAEAEGKYTNEFRAIPAATTYRPPRLTAKPRVHGAISGIVEAQNGKYAELDAQGRYHVRFMLDQGPAAKGSASSLLRMAQPHAGAGYGFHFPLRDGVEVMLTCIEGDPDRPIITGAVPNPVTPSTVGAGNAMRNVIRTGGGTEINIDDNETGTRFKVTTPDKNTVLQLGAPNAPVQGIFLGTDQDAEMKAGVSLKMDAGVRVDIIGGNNLNESAPWIDVKAAAKYRLGSPLVEVNGQEIDIRAAGNLNESAAWVDVHGGSKVRIGAPDVELGCGDVVKAHATNIDVIAGANITLGAGGMIVIHGAGNVTVTAPEVNVNGTGVVNVKGGTIKLNC